jgi:Antitoxin Xre/MbcA/ParS C-terminal toxin-binding domain
MSELIPRIATAVGPYWAALVGFLIVAAYARQRFNEPTFPKGETLPSAVEPLRYLFLRPAYTRARWTYVVMSLLLYLVLLVPGDDVLKIFQVKSENFPPQAWALLVALLLVGLLPTANVKWLTMIEESLRRAVHEWFLVPTGLKKTISLLADAPYQPPATLLADMPEAQRKLKDDLELRTSSLRYRWARATMLVASLNQIGTGGAHPLHRAAFEPFQEDFEAIRARYRALAQDIPAHGKAISDEREEALKRSVDDVLQRIYAYISWGVRHQSDSDSATNRTLEKFGFTIPVVEGRSLFDIIALPVGLVALVTIGFWFAYDAISGALSSYASQDVMQLATSGGAAIFMYGWATFTALKQRGTQIEERVWREGSPKCLIPISIKAGLGTWIVIVVVTVMSRHADTLQSLAALVRLDWEAKIRDQDVVAWSFLFARMLTALPWFLVGATASAVLASRLGGDVRHTDKAYRARDAAVLGASLFAAVGFAQLMQSALESLGHAGGVPLQYVWVFGFLGLVCGAVLGLMVPHACRANVVTPPDPIMARTLADLLNRADNILGSEAGAKNWVFMPHQQLRGITPAEAIQYQGYAERVRSLLDGDASREREEARTERGERLAPVVVIEGRRNPSSDAAA